MDNQLLLQQKFPQDSDSGEESSVVAMKGLKKAFNGVEVLKGIDLNLHKNENIVVLGKSGSGKSVLIKCIVGLIKPDEGKLQVFNKTVDNLHQEELTEMRRKIGFLFQSAALYDSMTVKENLEFPLKRNNNTFSQRQINELVMEALENVGLQNALDKMPGELSGGMRKRIGLARSFILKPQLMLYDEPTTGLDPVTSKEISHLIISMQKRYGISSIIITHDMPCAEITADRMVLIKEGKIYDQGTYAELSNTKDPWVKDFFR